MYLVKMVMAGEVGLGLPKLSIPVKDGFLGCYYVGEG